MSIKLEALSPTSGWAITSQADEYYLIRPPYQLGRREKLSFEETHQAVKMLNLKAEEKSFTGWKELIDSLEKEMIRRSDPELLERATEASRRLLEGASSEDLHLHLDRLEARLEDGDWLGTWRSLNVLIGLGPVKNDPELFRRCHTLLGLCVETEKEQSKLRAKVRQGSETQANWFKDALNVYGKKVIGKLTFNIVDKRQVLSMTP